MRDDGHTCHQHGCILTGELVCRKPLLKTKNVEENCCLSFWTNSYETCIMFPWESRFFSYHYDCYETHEWSVYGDGAVWLRIWEL
jgi:hypothetical protein